MPTPILATKLHIPPPRRQLVPRPHLIERLNEGLHRKLTLISAPAGFGKTTLLTEWITGSERPAAWLSLDEGDGDPPRFLAYFVAALQTIAANRGVDVLRALQSPQPPPTKSLLTSLLNDLAAIPDDFVLVLDDYHLADSPHVSHALAFLIERQPPHMHLVIATRQDPDLPLARLRARDQLTELRVKDLRFTEAEAAAFLNQAMGLRLSPEAVLALETRTEGWIAGLQLAALSMQGLDDTAGFIHSFTGSHRFVLDYLLEEVLHKQPEPIQTFLLQTSILERMCGPLCDAVLLHSSAAGQETLEHLERANLFVIPLDNERRWYRYHHLFAELLTSRLTRAYPDQVAELHRRASDWYADNDLPYEAITHALAVQDWSRAAEIIERRHDELPAHGETNTRLGWFEAFPPQVLLDRPRLGLVYAWALLLSNQLDRAERQLDQLAPLVQAAPSLLGELYVIRVMIATRRFDRSAFIELARQALSRVPPEEASPRSRILLTLGVAYEEMSGDIVAAKSAFREAYELGKATPSVSAVGNAPLPLIALAYLADYEWLGGHLREASRMYEQALELADQWGGQSSIALCLVQQGRAGLLYEWNDLDGAARALQECIRIGELWRNPRLLVPAFGLSAMIMQARGQAAEALALIRRAVQVTRESSASPPDLGMLAFYQISLWIAQNDFQAIAQWEQGHDSGWPSRIGRGRDLLATVLARAWIARYDRQQARPALSQAHVLIESALDHSQTNGLMFNVTRLLLLDALALYAQAETASAMTVLKRALTLAEPENYVRSFIDIGLPVKDFLVWGLESQSLSEPHLRAYVSKLLAHFGAASPLQPSQPTGDTPIEPLTERERQVLRLIAQGLSNREIGERLYLALDTVKGHNRRLFDKLQVSRRTEAIARARELGLL